MKDVKLLIFIVFCAASIVYSSSVTSQQVAERPIPISAPIPRYPALAMARRISGTVLVDVQVNSEGKVLEAKPIMGAELLRESAKRAALDWRFKPFTSASGTFTVRLTFIFHDDSYIAPEKKPDFKSPYQIEIQTPGFGS